MLDIPQIPIDGDRETRESHEIPGAKRNSWAFWRPKSMRRWSKRPGTWLFFRTLRETKGESCDFNGIEWDFNWISMKFCWISWDFVGKPLGKKTDKVEKHHGFLAIGIHLGAQWEVGGGKVGSNSPRREHLYMMCFVKLYLIYEF